MILVDRLDAPVDDRQGLESKEVEFHQTGFFDVVLVELRDQGAARLFCVQRDKFGEFSRCNHHTTGMPTDVAHYAFQFVRHFHDLADFVIVGDEVA